MKRLVFCSAIMFACLIQIAFSGWSRSADGEYGWMEGKESLGTIIWFLDSWGKLDCDNGTDPDPTSYKQTIYFIDGNGIEVYGDSVTPAIQWVLGPLTGNWNAGTLGNIVGSGAYLDLSSANCIGLESTNVTTVHSAGQTAITGGLIEIHAGLGQTATLEGPSGIFLQSGSDIDATIGGTYILKLSGDADDYLILSTDHDTPMLSTSGGCNLRITSDGGTIDFNDDNLLTTGTVSGVNVTSGVDPGHTHTGSSISGIDISDDTNLAVTVPITLTGDTIGFQITSIGLASVPSIKDFFIFENSATGTQCFNSISSLDQFWLNLNSETTNITNGAFSCTTTGYASFAADTDTMSYFGRAAIGYNSGLASDYAAFSHYDQRTSGTGYALAQNTTGTTFLNGASAIYFGINGAYYGTINSSGDFAYDTDTIYADVSTHRLGINTTTPSYDLDVNGQIGADANEDQYHFLGRSWIGYNGTDADAACFGHYDNRSSASYALMQESNGTTSINTASGRDMNFRINDSDKGKLESDGDFWMDATTTFFVDASTDAVCLGRNYTDTLSGLQLHLYSNNATNYALAGTKAIIEESTNPAYLSFLSTSGSSAWYGVLFGDGSGSSQYAGDFVYNPNLDVAMIGANSEAEYIKVGGGKICATLPSVSNSYYVKYNPGTAEVTYQSSARWRKENIKALKFSDEFKEKYLHELTLRKFDWKKTHEPDWGFIADEAGSVLPEMAIREQIMVSDPDGDIKQLSGNKKSIQTDRWEGFRYDYLPMVNREILIDHDEKIEEMQSEINDLKNQLQICMKKIDELENKDGTFSMYDLDPGFALDESHYFILGHSIPEILFGFKLDSFFRTLGVSLSKVW